MLVKLPKPFSAGTSANEVSKASLVPLLRFGPRQLAGVDGLYHLKQLGAVAGKAAAVTTTEARTVQSSAQLPRATRPYMRPMRAAYMPTSVLLRKPAARKPHRKGVDWQLRVLTDAAQCFEDVAAADRVDVAEKYRANPPQPQPPQQPQRPSHDPLVAQMLRVRNLRATLAEAEDMVGRASSTLAPLLCTLACALLQATPLDATDEAEAIAEAEALGARAATCAAEPPPPTRRAREPDGTERKRNTRVMRPSRVVMTSITSQCFSAAVGQKDLGLFFGFGEKARR